jgi:hypothetical protein
VRFKHIVRHRVLQTTIDGVTYEVRYYKGHRGVFTSYWVVKDSEIGLDEEATPPSRIVNNLDDARKLITELVSVRKKRNVQPT